MIRRAAPWMAAALLGAPVAAAAQQELATSRGASAGTHFGFALAFVGDLDGDGSADFAVGAPGTAGSTGRVRVYSGRTTSVLHTFDGLAAGDHYGAAICGIGDLVGDGRDDLAIGAPRGVAWLSSAIGGSVELRSGATGAVLRTVVGTASSRGFGAALASGEGFDGDSVEDLIVGAPGGNSAAGAA